jgi:hypothetical protein
MKGAAIAVMLLLATAGGAAAQNVEADEAAAAGWRLRGDRGELVRVLPTPARAGDVPGQSREAPPGGATVYRASYGSGNLIDHGGLEIAGAGFVPVFYNQGSMGTLPTDIQNFAGAFGSGEPDYTVIQQYGSHATIAPTLRTPGPYLDNAGTPSTISDAGIQSYLAGLFAAGRIVPDAYTVYGVYLPPGTTSTMGSYSSCVNYCGYHGVFAWKGIQVKYAVFPYLTCAGCSLSGRSVLDMLTIVTSHEIREAVTDPGDNGKNAWYDRRGYEADDKCAWHHLYPMAAGGYWVQPEYSNAAKGCVVP